jgi:hypothetical protein
MTRALLPLVAVALVGCGGAGDGTRICTLQLVWGVGVEVVDPAGNHVCDAIVTLRSGGQIETARRLGDPERCYYVGAGEAPGSWTIDVARPGLPPPPSVTVTVGWGDSAHCHVATQQVRIVAP